MSPSPGSQVLRQPTIPHLPTPTPCIYKEWPVCREGGGQSQSQLSVIVCTLPRAEVGKQACEGIMAAVGAYGCLGESQNGF